ncbi:uncharacterized protein LOC144447229 [Glandiceps talaboti]
MTSLLSIFDRLNIPLSKHKTEDPMCVLEYLGILLDIELMEAHLPLDKLDHSQALLTSFLGFMHEERHSQSSGSLELRSMGDGCPQDAHLYHTSLNCLHQSSTSTITSSSQTTARKTFVCGSTLPHNGMVSRYFWMMLQSRHRAWISIPMLWCLVRCGQEWQSLGYGGYYQGHWFQGLCTHDLRLDLNISLSIDFQDLHSIVAKEACCWGESWS